MAGSVGGYTSFARPEELAKAVYFLSSQASEWASVGFQWGFVFEDVKL
jgi:hypothetical protein